jgi:hypothetical protein
MRHLVFLANFVGVEPPLPGGQPRQPLHFYPQPARALLRGNFGLGELDDFLVAVTRASLTESEGRT